MSITISSGITIQSGFVGYSSPIAVIGTAGNTFTLDQVIVSGNEDFTEYGQHTSYQGILNGFSVVGNTLVGGGFGTWFALAVNQAQANFFNSIRDSTGIHYDIDLELICSPGTITERNPQSIFIFLPGGAPVVNGEHILCTISGGQNGNFYNSGTIVFPVVITTTLLYGA